MASLPLQHKHRIWLPKSQGRYLPVRRCYKGLENTASSVGARNSGESIENRVSGQVIILRHAKIKRDDVDSYSGLYCTSCGP